MGLPDTVELDAIASAPPEENSFTVENFDKLEGLDEKIFSALCPVGKPGLIHHVKTLVCQCIS